MVKKINRRELLKTTSALRFVALTSRLDASEASVNNQNPLLTVHSRLESESWLMPAHFGPPSWGKPWPDQPGEAYYGDVTGISIGYLTNGKQLRKYLPHPYELEGPPVVTVAYSMNREITWLAGGEYNIVRVTVRATYPGEIDKVSGDYVLVLWENLTDPILTGRETAGIPKIYGEIEDHQIFNGVWRTSLSNRGKTLLEIHAGNLTKMNPDELERLKASSLQGKMLGWKYIPNETASGPIISYATEFPVSSRCIEAWSASGSLKWYPQTWEENPTQSHIVNALHSLPVNEIVSCTVSKSSKTMETGKVRRLR